MKISEKITKLRTGKFLIAEALLALFVIFTVLVKMADVKAIGPEGSKVGLATLNGPVASFLPFNVFFYTISEILGIVLLVVVFVFAILGAYQLIRGRGIGAVDDKLILLGFFYVTVLAVYILFNMLALNCRPLIMDVAEGLEPSYPSSHTLLATCVAGTAMMLVDSYIHNAKYAITAKIVLATVGALTVVARLLSGVHWLTDILGSLIISAALVTLFGAFAGNMSEKKRSAPGNK